MKEKWRGPEGGQERKARLPFSTVPGKVLVRPGQWPRVALGKKSKWSFRPTEAHGGQTKRRLDSWLSPGSKYFLPLGFLINSQILIESLQLPGRARG